MDRITKSYVEAFMGEQALRGLDNAKLFEHFANYCVLSDAYDEEFNVEDVHTGGGGDLSLDGVAILVNGILVNSTDEVDDLLDLNGYLDVRFLFVQAKRSSSFSGDEIGAFIDGVFNFFEEDLRLPVSEQIEHLRTIMARIYERSVSFKHQRPTCEMAFVTTGNWQDDAYLAEKIRSGSGRLSQTNLFSRVEFLPYGAKEIQQAWQRSKNSSYVEFTFANKVTLPDIDGISEAYLGVIPFSEFLKVLSEDSGDSIRRQIFYDNVRDYQGDNPVNTEMASSIGTTDGQNRFAVLNNGVTLVARSLKNTGNKFVASDYQIVNGCQTSHVLFNNRVQVPDGVSIPFKVVATNDEEIINSIITATNRQTEVSDEDLFAMNTFQKNLEEYFASFPEKHRLHYERRSKQYAAIAGIEKVRIIGKTAALRAFAAMFLDAPHRAARYYSDLKGLVGKDIFNQSHKPDPYYAAAFGYYKLEYLFRNGQIPVSYKPARYHLLMGVRYLVAGPETPAFNANKLEGYVDLINTALWSDDDSVSVFGTCCNAVDRAIGRNDALTRDSVKTQAFTEAVISALTDPSSASR